MHRKLHTAAGISQLLDYEKQSQFLHINIFPPGPYNILLVIFYCLIYQVKPKDYPPHRRDALITRKHDEDTSA